MSFRKSYLFILTAALLMLTGCGYRLGSLMHPQVKTIAIAPVKNDTLVYHMAADARKLLAEAFMVDGSLKVKDMKHADAILYARVKKVVFREVADVSRDDDENYHSYEWSVTVSIEFTVVIPTRKTPLVSTQLVTGSANFQGYGDLDTGRSEGVRQACYEAAVKVVQATTEAW
jgi:outer membrane lipopolysaccharide assembly protein LptE/RlpB